MKRILTIFAAVLICSASVFAQKTRTINGDITKNMTLYTDTIYNLSGYVYVKNNATLTIQAGTIIKGVSGTKATLVITRNGKIEAKGTATKPIVFTSDQNPGNRKPSDWGGIVILGKATINRTDCATCPGKDVASNEAGAQNAIEGDLDNTSGDGLYGGTDDAHSSGTISYVRIEFAGTVITPGNEINGLTMGGVGSGTTIDHVQTSFVNDDGFEWFGGTVNAKYLISYRNVDDDFDTDFGYRGKVQFGVAMRDSALYDIGSGPTTNGFESDNDGSGTTATPNTEATFSNMTIVGPLAHGKALDYTNSFQNGARIRRNSAMSLFNSIIMGYPTGIFIDGTASANKLMNDTLLIKNNIVAGFTLKAINAPSALLTDVRAKLMANGNDTVVSAGNILMDAFNYSNPNWTVKAGGKATTGASFTGNKISDAFFTSTTYRGAFGEDNWTSGWANFDPQNTDYSKPTVGIKNDISVISAINVFPNPAANELNVSLNLEKSERVSASIYSIDGKLLNVLKTQQFNAGNNSFKVDVKNLNNGLYILKINSPSGQQNVRFSVVK